MKRSFGCFCMDPRTSCRSRNVEHIFNNEKQQTSLWMVDYWLIMVICFFLMMVDSGYLMRRHQFNHQQKNAVRNIAVASKNTLQETNIPQLGKSKIIFKSALVGDMLVPGRVLLVQSINQSSVGWCAGSPYNGSGRVGHAWSTWVWNCQRLGKPTTNVWH